MDGTLCFWHSGTLLWLIIISFFPLFSFLTTFGTSFIFICPSHCNYGQLDAILLHDGYSRFWKHCKRSWHLSCMLPHPRSKSTFGKQIPFSFNSFNCLSKSAIQIRLFSIRVSSLEVVVVIVLNNRKTRLRKPLLCSSPRWMTFAMLVPFSEILLSPSSPSSLFVTPQLDCRLARAATTVFPLNFRMSNFFKLDEFFMEDTATVQKIWNIHQCLFLKFACS